MKVNIEFEDNIDSLSRNIASGILSKEVKDVCSKINYPCDHIIWNVFDQDNPNKYKKRFDIAHSMGIYKGTEYANTDCINKINISKLAIMPKYQGINPSHSLADIILDEITHIVTGCDHGNRKYEEQLKEFKKIYYKQ